MKPERDSKTVHRPRICVERPRREIGKRQRGRGERTAVAHFIRRHLIFRRLCAKPPSLLARGPAWAEPARAAMSSYDEVDLEDMEWNAELGAFTFQCPCGDVFQITPAELRAGEEIAHCPSCSLVVTVVYEDDDLKELIPEGF